MSIGHAAQHLTHSLLSFDSIKPPLKKVSKTAQQMEKIRMFTAKIGQMDYRQSLKTVTKKFELEDKEVEKVSLVGRSRSGKTLSTNLQTFRFTGETRVGGRFIGQISAN